MRIDSQPRLLIIFYMTLNTVTLITPAHGTRWGRPALAPYECSLLPTPIQIGWELDALPAIVGFRWPDECFDLDRL